MPGATAHLALVAGDVLNLPAEVGQSGGVLEVLVGVAGVDHPLGGRVDGSEHGEAGLVVAGLDGEDLAVGAGAAALGGGRVVRAGDVVDAVVGGAALLVGVDGEPPGALGVLLIASAVEALDGPLSEVRLGVQGHGSGHTLGPRGRSRGGKRRGGEERNEDSLGEHLGKVLCW